MKILLSLLTIFLFLLYSGDLHSADTGTLPGQREYSADNIKGFARYLVEKKEYYRANLEIDRLESYYPGYLTPLEYHTTRNYLLFSGEQYRSVTSYSYTGNDKRTRLTLSLFRFDSYMKLTDYDGAGKILDSLESDNPFDEIFLKRRFYLSVMTGKLDRPLSGKKEREQFDFSAYNELQRYAVKTTENMKSPVSALFWGVVPGMGYIYSGERNTGMVALITIALNAAISYYAFSRGSESIGIFVGIIGTFFYTGSIMGGYMAANKYNRNMTDHLNRRLSRDLQLKGDLEELYNTQGIGQSGKKE